MHFDQYFCPDKQNDHTFAKNVRCQSLTDFGCSTISNLGALLRDMAALPTMSGERERDRCNVNNPSKAKFQYRSSKNHVTHSPQQFFSKVLQQLMWKKLIKIQREHPYILSFFNKSRSQLIRDPPKIVSKSYSELLHLHIFFEERRTCT